MMDWILEFRTPCLTPIFKGFSFLGDEYFFLLVLPLGYWLWNRGIMGRTGAILLFSAVLNGFLKEIFAIPRPSVEHLVYAEEFSFPSGHAQTAMVLWGWLAIEIHKRWAYWLAGVLVVGISASRVYLGVHFPTDVIAGILIGGVTLVGFYYLFRVDPKIWHHIGPTRQIFFWFFVLMGLFMAFPHDVPGSTLKAGAALIGFWGGVLHERKILKGVAGWRWPAGLLKTLTGLAGLVFCVYGLNLIFISIGYHTDMARFIRYFLAGSWISWGLPWLAVQIGWEENDS